MLEGNDDGFVVVTNEVSDDGGGSGDAGGQCWWLVHGWMQNGTRCIVLVTEVVGAS